MTLTELLVSLAVMAVVLLAGWSGFGVARTGADASDREAWLSHEISSPMLAMEGILMQQLGIVQSDSRYPTYDGANAYALLCTSDRDNDGVSELTLIQAQQGGLYISSCEGTATPISRLLGADNYNLEGETPLFTYFDAAGNQITQPGEVSSFARSVEVSIRARRAGEDLVSSRRVWFRNRS